jgi:CRP-like cAMP-binding protein
LNPAKTMKKIALIDNETNCFLCNNCLKQWIPAILSQKKNFKFKKGETIFKEGDPVTGIYFVNTGIVKVHKRWGEEKELIVRFANEGTILGHRGLGGSDATYPISATALGPGIVGYVDMDFFETTLTTNNEFTQKLMLLFAGELRESEKKMRNQTHMPVKGRVAEALITLKNQFGLTEKGFINIELSRQDLASFVGANYETVFRMINELVQEKLLILSGKSIAISSDEALLKLINDSI